MAFFGFNESLSFPSAGQRNDDSGNVKKVETAQNDRKFVNRSQARACKSSLSAALAKRIAALGTEMLPHEPEFT